MRVSRSIGNKSLLDTENFFEERVVQELRLSDRNVDIGKVGFIEQF
jgi:hypothetical protein